jgi:hypothetical protein
MVGEGHGFAARGEPRLGEQRPAEGPARRFGTAWVSGGRSGRGPRSRTRKSASCCGATSTPTSGPTPTRWSSSCGRTHASRCLRTPPGIRRAGGDSDRHAAGIRPGVWPPPNPRRGGEQTASGRPLPATARRIGAPAAGARRASDRRRSRGGDHLVRLPRAVSGVRPSAYALIYRAVRSTGPDPSGEFLADLRCR